jgi:hypothetical protein
MLTSSDPSGTQVSQGPPLPTELSQQQIDVCLAAGRDLIERSRPILEAPDQAGASASSRGPRRLHPRTTLRNEGLQRPLILADEREPQCGT